MENDISQLSIKSRGLTDAVTHVQENLLVISIYLLKLLGASTTFHASCTFKKFRISYGDPEYKARVQAFAEHILCAPLIVQQSGRIVMQQN